MAPMTDGQVIALVVVNCISSWLSIVGSSTIVYLVFMTKKSSVYNRMMLGMSMFDILNSLVILVHPFLLPAEGGRISAHGNDQTCTMMGFFTQLSTSVPLYNISLNAFFLATVVFRVSELKFQKYAEPSLHAMSVLFPLVTASVGAGLSLYSEKEFGLICWVGDYPEGCGGEDPSVPCLDPIFILVFGVIPFGVSILFLLISNGMIYWKVRSTGRKSQQYRHTKFVLAAVNNSAHQQQCSTVTTNNSNISSHRSHGAQQNDVEGGNSTGFARRSWEFVRTPLTLRNNTSESGAALRSTSREYEQGRAVAIQATLYVLACLTSMMVVVAIGIQQSAGVQREQESEIYGLLVFFAITLPLQGFLNFLIFIRPRYLQWRRLFPMRSRLWAVRQCLKNKVPKAKVRTAPRIESQILGCNEPDIPAIGSLADLQADPAVCAGDNDDDATETSHTGILFCGRVDLGQRMQRVNDQHPKSMSDRGAEL